MKRILVTDAEFSSIQTERAKQKHKKAEARFHRKVFITAHLYNEHCEKNGESPGFSDFVNDFEYQDADSRMMYEAFLQVRELIKSFQLPRRAS